MHTGSVFTSSSASTDPSQSLTISVENTTTALSEQNNIYTCRLVHTEHNQKRKLHACTMNAWLYTDCRGRHHIGRSHTNYKIKQYIITHGYLLQRPQRHVKTPNVDGKARFRTSKHQKWLQQSLLETVNEDDVEQRW